MSDDTVADAVDNVVRSWITRETAVWNCRRVDVAAAVSEYQEYNRTRASTFLFEWRSGEVTILDKPGFCTRSQLDAKDWSVEPNVYVALAMIYRDFLGNVAKQLCPDINTIIALDVDDEGFTSETAPIFVIQKLVESNSLLLPHHELITNDYFQWLDDSVPYPEKSLSAIFAGGTTGPEQVTVDVVRQLSLPRLRAAVFFKENPRVDFRLPKLVQCTPEAEQLLRDMGFGIGECSWDEMFRHKFLISMDGNAGACSRLMLAMKSNSVPLKYASPHHVHFSRDLVPWFHYVPISFDAEIDAILDLEQDQPGCFEFIAAEGRKFVQAYLSPQRVLDYTADLIRAYTESFEPSRRAGATVGLTQPRHTLRPSYPYVYGRFAHSYARFGRMLATSGDLPAAEAAFRKAVQLEPTGRSFRQGLAEMLHRQGRTMQALAIVERLIAEGARESSLYVLCGEMLRWAGDRAGAEAAFRLADQFGSNKEWNPADHTAVRRD